MEIMKSSVAVLFVILNTYSKGFEIRLWPTNTQGTEGFVEAFYNGSWGYVGNPVFRFSDTTATFLCNTLNLSVFGYGSGHTLMGNYTNKNWLLSVLECNGEERNIDECVAPSYEWKYRNYSGSWYYEYGSRLHCVDYKLNGGPSQNTGLVLASISNKVHTLCYKGFDMNAANVVCNHLQYNGAVKFTESDPDSVPLYSKRISCNGNERSLEKCTHYKDVLDNCAKAVYITCRAVRLTNWNKYTDEGAVEIFINGSWGFVGFPGIHFDDITSQYLCGIFGFRNGGFSTQFHSLESYYRQAWVSSLTCNGTETDIMQCNHSRFSFVGSLMHTYKRGTWLHCYDYNITSIRLVNGSKSFEGKVELEVGGRWGSISTIYMHEKTKELNAEVVCRNLGYSGLDKVLTDGRTSGDERIWMSALSCNGNDLSLQDCFFNKGQIVPFYHLNLAVRCVDLEYDSCKEEYPCRNGGKCVDYPIGYKCICTSGYEGSNCENDINECLSEPCYNDGKCIDLRNGYRCSCAQRYSGERCQIEINECLSEPCENNGTCLDEFNRYICLCAQGFDGERCQNDINECLSEPCVNDGKCVDAMNGYLCSCGQGYSGDRCQSDIDECLSQPCENSGECINAINGFVCSCEQGYEGNRCQNVVENQTKLIAILISSICVLAIAILVTLCCCLRYRREQKKTKSEPFNDLKRNQRKEIEKDIPTEKVEGRSEEVYDEIKDDHLSKNSDYITSAADVELEKDACGYITLANNEQKVRYNV